MNRTGGRPPGARAYGEALEEPGLAEAEAQGRPRRRIDGTRSSGTSVAPGPDPADIELRLSASRAPNEAAHRLDDRCERQLPPPSVDAAAEQHDGALAPSHPRDPVDEAGLADAGLAGDERRAAPSPAARAQARPAAARARSSGRSATGTWRRGGRRRLRLRRQPSHRTLSRTGCPRWAGPLVPRSTRFGGAGGAGGAGQAAPVAPVRRRMIRIRELRGDPRPARLLLPPRVCADQAVVLGLGEPPGAHAASGPRLPWSTSSVTLLLLAALCPSA